MIISPIAFIKGCSDNVRDSANVQILNEQVVKVFNHGPERNNAVSYTISIEINGVPKNADEADVFAQGTGSVKMVDLKDFKNGKGTVTFDMVLPQGATKGEYWITFYRRPLFGGRAEIACYGPVRTISVGGK